MNNRGLLIAAEFVHPVEKDRWKHYKLTQNSVSFSCQSKQVSRCCIDFAHELICQILINQSVKIGRRAWPTRDHSEKSQKQLSSLPVLAAELNFRVRGLFEIKILIVRHINTPYFIWIKKNELEAAIILKLVTCQRITSRNNRTRWVNTWARDTVRWYWSADTLFWQLSIDHNIDVQYVCNISFPVLPNRALVSPWCGRTDGRCTVTWLPNFLGWVDLLSYGLR